MSLLSSNTDIPFRDISKLLINNSALKNPYGTLLSSTTTRMNTLNTYVTSASTVGNPLYNAGVSSNASQIIIAINNIKNTLTRFTTHTNSLSGNGLINGLNGVNFATISTIVSTVQEYRDDGSICELVNKAFGAILNADAIITQINLLLGLVDNILTIPDQIANNINFVKQLLEDQIVADLNTFTDAQLEALQYAASAAINSLINNPCIAEILSRVGTDELKAIIRDKSSQIFK